MDQPQRANAAQLAARNIKSARSKHPRRAGVHTPRDQSVFQFSTPTNEGGLFGGSIKAAGTFDFAAPAGINFAPSFENNSNTASDLVDNEDGRLRGDNRDTKRLFGQNSGLEKPAFQIPNPFPASQPSPLFGSINSQQPSGANGFQFGGATQHGASVINSSTKPSNSLFPFGSAPQHTSPSIGFGSAPAANNAGSSIFNFSNHQSSQSTSSSRFQFGTSAPPAQPASNPFTFGPASALASTSSALLGSITATSGHTFGVEPTQPTSNSFKFSTSTTTSAISKPLFSINQNTQTQSPATSFSSTTTAPGPSTNFFGANPSGSIETSNLNHQRNVLSPAVVKNDLSGKQEQNLPLEPENDLFSRQKQDHSNESRDKEISNQKLCSSNLSGQQNQSSFAGSNPFTHLKPSISAVTNPTSSLLGQSKESPEKVSNLFNPMFVSSQGSASDLQSQQTSNEPSGVRTKSDNIFGNLYKGPNPFCNIPQPPKAVQPGPPAAVSLPEESLFGVIGPKELPNSEKVNVDDKENKENLLAKDVSSTNALFGNLNKPVDQSVMEPRVNGSTVNLFQQTMAPSCPSKSNALINSIGQSQLSYTTSSNQKYTNHMIESKALFGPQQSLIQPTLSLPKIDDAPTSNSTSPGLLKATHNQSEVQSSLQKPEMPRNRFSPSVMPKNSSLERLAMVSQITNEEIEQFVPSEYDETGRKQFYASYRLRALNQAMENLFADLPLTSDPQIALEFFAEERRLILEQCEEFTGKSKRKLSSTEVKEDENPNKRRRQEASISSAMSPAFTASESSNPLSKRKHTVEDEENQGKQNPSKRCRDSPPASPQSKSNGASQSNGRLRASALKASQEDNIGQPNFKGESRVATACTPSTLKGNKRVGSFLDQDTPTELSPLKQNLQTPNQNPIVAASSTTESDTAGKFRSILESTPIPSSSPRKQAPLSSQKFGESGKEEMPRPNPFSNLPTFSPTKPDVTLTANSSVAKDSTKVPVANLFVPKLSRDSANPFFPKATTTPSTASSKNISEANTAVVKPPVFTTGPADFLAQFCEQAKDTEAKMMEKDKLEDMDSDDDEAEWEAKWKAKRHAKAKEAEEFAKTKRATFVPGKGFTIVEADASSSTKDADVVSTVGSPQPEPKTDNKLSGSTTASAIASQDSNIFNSSNMAAKPDDLGSKQSSVLNVPGNTSFSKNIFGHLSDVDSGKDTDGKDVDTSDGEASDTDEDSENKDPTYQPGQETPAGPGTPGTPVEKTGAGIISAKKTGLFSFGPSSATLETNKAESSTDPASSTPVRDIFIQATQRVMPNNDKENSGTISPGGSLFDRITRLPDTKVSLHASEEKENTPTTTKNILGGTNNPFSNSVNSAPSDKTWKTDSPIRFGAANTVDAPKFSLTAPTPTQTGIPNVFGLNDSAGSKPAPVLNLFEAKVDSMPATSAGGAPFPNLFGSKTEIKSSPGAQTSTINLFGSSAKPSSTGLGFGFGVSSGSSSLFPSVAGSATTSRATSPGGTTDNESGVDNDPDAERHEQINLTSCGPGEEDEEVLHEVRAKALKFSPKDGSDKSNVWETRGVGPLRILKHKDTTIARMLLRGDPSGKVVLNKGIVSSVNYEATGKTVKVLTTSESGKALETWILQVKTSEFAQKLAEVLEECKNA